MQTADILPENKPIKPKHPGGRPSKYNPDIIRKTAEYLENYSEYGDLIPSMAGLSKILNVTRERLAIWAKDKNKGEFSRMVSMLTNNQEAALISGGLGSVYNSGITKLLLSKHGYHDNPQGNQGNTGITVNVNRSGVVLKSGGQTLEIEADNTLEHTPE